MIPITAVAISGSASRPSKSPRLLAHAVDGLARHGVSGVFIDLCELPADALAGKVAIAVATGAEPAHALVVDHGLRPLLASVGALVVPTGIYGTDGQFAPDGPESTLLARVDRAVSEALEVTGHVAL